MLANAKKARKTFTKLNQQEAADALGTTIHSIQNWEQGKSEPDADMVCAMADLYGCSTDFIYGTRFAESVPTMGDMTYNERECVKLFRSLNNEQQEAIIRLMKSI